MSPRVTVVTAYHNRPDFVDGSIESLKAQDYDDLRVIAIDDGSRDDTAARLRKHHGGRVEVRVQANRGFTPTMKATFDEISSEFVAVHGSGDISHPSRISRQVAAMDANPDCVMSAVRHRTVDPVTGKSLGSRTGGNDRLVSRSDIEFTTPFTHGTVMYRTDAYLAAGGYEPLMKWCSDWDLWFRMLRAGDALVVGEVLYDRLAQVDGVSFHPAKSLEQVKYKRLAQKLSRLTTDDDRAALLALLEVDGLEIATSTERSKITLDVARRAAKLALMGRHEAAGELRALAEAQGLDNYTLPYRLLLPLAGLVGRTNLPADTMISAGRALFRRQSEKG